MQSRTIIFDLDGTLINSSKGILGCLSQAFSEAGVRPTCEIEPSLIGPPLDVMIREVSHGLSLSEITTISELFKHNYDSWGYREAFLYDGIFRMLETLDASGCELHITTNKRASPTQLIINHLGICDFFRSVYSLDSAIPMLASKADLLAKQVVNEGIDKASAIYVGDRSEDWIAARSNNIQFAWAQWGFTGSPIPLDDGSITLSSPDSSMLLAFAANDLESN